MHVFLLKHGALCGIQMVHSVFVNLWIVIQYQNTTSSIDSMALCETDHITGELQTQRLICTVESICDSRFEF